ncbi:SDR family NAD(P)-dependent oxidoreductase [Actinomadura sp. K4S16]|uniref:SDR family NAD(P)-dependent oxidoreductase n=1 Tax=Actinomadura sp. K4S16 TaxID=1316147 RepID=UPI0011EFC9C6|nr:SDR family oxidoreductase [Actinomadura sp. K4S16]
MNDGTPTGPRDLDGKVVLVTGGSRGIGRSLVLGAVARGARVAFCARSVGEAAQEVRAEAERLGGAGCVLPMAADVSRSADVDAFVEAALEAWGTVDVLVNNAAIDKDALLLQMPVAEFAAVLAVNLTGPFLMSRRVLREFLHRDTRGVIVNIGSIFDRGAPSQTAYSTSKGGLRGLTRAIAEEYGARGIRANLVVSGFVETALSQHMPERFRKAVLSNPLSRAGTAAEVASAVLLFAGGAGRAMNGATVYASGGIVDANFPG